MSDYAIKVPMGLTATIYMLELSNPQDLQKVMKYLDMQNLFRIINCWVVIHNQRPTL